LILVITGGTFFTTIAQTRKALLEMTRDNLRQVIGIVSSQLSPDEIQTISQFKFGQDQEPAYQALVQKFRNMRAMSPEITNFYVVRVNGNQVVFLLDDALENAAKIGRVYKKPDNKLFAAVTDIQISDNVYTDEWGTFLSGYAPVKGADGKTAFVIGADMLASTVTERGNFIGITTYLIVGIGILVAALVIGVFSLTIIRDINKLNRAAQKINSGETDIVIDIKRKDEIGELADSFSRMVVSLKIMMDTREKRE
jgi:adenylate cyclase